MSTPTWFGTLYAVEDARGVTRDVPEVALGLLPGGVWVTAPDKPSLLRGAVYPMIASLWAHIGALYYRRRRPEGNYWRHPVDGTDLGIGGPAPVLRFAARANAAPPSVCRMAGTYICDG